MNFKIHIPILKIINKNKITKYCVNCGHYVPDITYGTRPKCNRQSKQNQYTDPITGDIRCPNLRTDAKQERETPWPFNYLNGTCGKSARFYKLKLRKHCNLT